MMKVEVNGKFVEMDYKELMSEEHMSLYASAIKDSILGCVKERGKLPEFGITAPGTYATLYQLVLGGRLPGNPEQDGKVHFLRIYNVDVYMDPYYNEGRVTWIPGLDSVSGIPFSVL